MTKTIAVVGASGRSGSQVVNLLSEFPDFKLGAAIVSPNSKHLGAVCLSSVNNGGKEVLYSSDLEASIARCDAVIDFSLPESSIHVARSCAACGKPLIIATTGHSQGMLDEIRALAARTTILLASNTSIGIYVLNEIAALAHKLLGPKFDAAIFESHHRNKRDAPSGTAITLAKRLGISARDSVSKVASLRGGDVAGDHTVFFLGDGERIELSHRVKDRSVFARGALRLLSELVNKPHGFYEVSDVINTNSL